MNSQHFLSVRRQLTELFPKASRIALTYTANRITNEALIRRPKPYDVKLSLERHNNPRGIFDTFHVKFGHRFIFFGRKVYVKVV